jgi:hypothetical protein
VAAFSTIMEWKAEGRAEGMAEGLAAGMLEAHRSDLTRVIRLRFPAAPYEVATAVRGMTDLDQLGRWLEAAVLAPTVEVFQVMAHDADARAARR